MSLAQGLVRCALVLVAAALGGFVRACPLDEPAVGTPNPPVVEVGPPPPERPGAAAADLSACRSELAQLQTTGRAAAALQEAWIASVAGVPQDWTDPTRRAAGEDRLRAAFATCAPGVALECAEYPCIVTTEAEPASFSACLPAGLVLGAAALTLGADGALRSSRVSVGMADGPVVDEARLGWRLRAHD